MKITIWFISHQRVLSYWHGFEPGKSNIAKQQLHFPSQMAIMQSFDVFFVVSLNDVFNKLLSV